MAAFTEKLRYFCFRRRNVVRNMCTFTNSQGSSKGERLSFNALILGCVGLAGVSGVCWKTLTDNIYAKSKEDGVNKENDHPTRSIQSKSLVQCMKEESGSPGVCVAVSVDGKIVWSEGFGFADVENRVLCSSKTVMRIASISKPITATAAAKLWEEGRLDLDSPIQAYISSFPEKTFDGVATHLTTRHLLSHLGGIRHYKKKLDLSNGKDPENRKKEMKSNQQPLDSGDRLINSKEQESEFLRKEYFIKEHYKTITDALVLFKDDPLLSVPGKSYLYTTHGWTLISAVIEKAAKQDFLEVMKKLFKDIGLKNTCADFNEKIIHHRARFYQRNNKGHLVNAPYVDNSYKWGGGGFLSTVGDLVRFGNILLYAKQSGDDKNDNTGRLPGFLKPETVTELWKIVTNTEGKGHKDGGYGLGWAVIPEKQEFGACNHQSETILHSGGAIGCSSILLMRPTYGAQPPKGVVVSLLVNLQEVSLEKTAMAVAASFQKVQSV
ncbi:serine beta-lactamase-like protein LACTB, mitochondrial isoform X2 [Acropora muricata]|uniref:serine beta-lactamase-like protein LACTB, mitochondrial isoform X2 n=1 Tax=Acropora muricata TaxID=159855 RepID=UPI0034E59A46